MDQGKQSKGVNKKAIQNDKVWDMKFHKISIEELEDVLNTKIESRFGLSEDQATLKLVWIGKNTLTERKGVPWFVKLLKEFTGPLALLLWVASFLCIIGFFLDTSDFSNLYLAIAIALCVIVIGLFSYF